MLLEGPVRTYRTLEHDARFRHGRRHDVRILALLGRALVEEIAVGAPGFQGGLHRRRRYRQIEESQRSFVGLQLPRHLVPSSVDIIRNAQTASRSRSVATREFGNIFVASARTSSSG